MSDIQTINVLPAVCDGIEQDAFETWAKSQHYNMDQHPLHWLFLNEKTNAARQGWKAGLEHSSNRAAAEIERMRSLCEGVAGALKVLTLAAGELNVHLDGQDYLRSQRQKVLAAMTNSAATLLTYRNNKGGDDAAS